MVIFILTRGGFDEMRDFITSVRPAVWVNAEVLSTAEISALRRVGIDLTCLTQPIHPENEDSIFDLLPTIAEHYPGERIWVETHGTPLMDSGFNGTLP